MAYASLTSTPVLPRVIGPARARGFRSMRRSRWCGGSARYRCVEPAYPLDGFSEDHPLAPAQAMLPSRAAWLAISCIQRDNASVASVGRRLGVDWHTVWDAIRPLLAELLALTSTCGTTPARSGRGRRS